MEIMTVQLNRMAEEQRDGGGGSCDDLPDGSAQDGSGSSSGGEGSHAPEGGPAGSIPNAAALPFDIVATAYRRKKLLEALDLDDK